MDAQAHRSDHTELHRRLTVALDLIAAQQRQIDALTARIDALEGGADNDSGVNDMIDTHRRAAERMSRWPRPAE